MMGSDDSYIDAFIVRDQANKSIVKVLSKTSSPATKEGNNYNSIAVRTVITVLRQSGRKETISLIVKNKPVGKGRDAFLQETGAFKKEIMMYLHVLNAMENLMKENDDNDGLLWCHMVGYNPYDCILLEDLSVQGFRMTDSRHVFLNLDHSLVVMQSLGRLHGLSKVIIRRGLLDQQDFSAYYLISNPKTTERVMGHCMKGSGKHIKTWGNEWEAVGDTFVKYSSKIHDEIRKVGEVPDENSKLIVMNHGDAWKCNMLFKYARDSEKPIDMRFIDFQLSHYNTAGWDLTYFLYGSVEPVIRRNHYDHLLQVYVHEMKKTWMSYGLPDSDIPEVEELKLEMDRLLPYRFITSFFYRPLFISKFHFDLEAVMQNTEMSEAIGMDTRSISNPDYRNTSEADLREMANQINQLALTSSRQN